MYNKLRQAISRRYKLENHDIFFVPSMAAGRVILSHLFHRQELARSAARQGCNLPASELHYSAAQPGEPGIVPLISHVDPASGDISDLRDCRGKGVVDATHSFASALHEELVRDSEIFIAPLDKPLAAALAIIALRTADFSTLLRSELRLFEQSTMPPEPLAQALHNISLLQ